MSFTSVSHRLFHLIMSMKIASLCPALRWCLTHGISNDARSAYFSFSSRWRTGVDLRNLSILPLQQWRRNHRLLLESIRTSLPPASVLSGLKNYCLNAVRRLKPLQTWGRLASPVATKRVSASVIPHLLGNLCA